ncbi:MAG TPA: MarR family transcriptional regulator [Solirubrobacteraceae bacterium]|nr:MarR family transcriptional regulator [Solirubrobacteraceae bacterium]
MATRPSTDTEVAEYAGQLFFRLWRASHTQVAEALESLGLTPALFGVLNVLGARAGAIQQEIGTAMAIDPSTMVSLIDQLEAAGLAERRPHPTDRRARAIAITPKGRRVLEKGRQMSQQVEDDVLRGLTAAERRQLITLLRRALGSAPPQSLWRAEEGD